MQAPSQIKVLNGMLKPSLAKFFLVFSLVFSCSTFAIEFRSISSVKAVLYDAPSQEATKLYILHNAYPVEVVVTLAEWTKIRDQLGALSWVENKALSSKRTVLVIAKTELKSAEDPASVLLATVEKDVVLELVSPNIKNGWVKVKHRDGVTGFLQVVNVWGLN